MSVVSRRLDVQQYLPKRRVYRFPETVNDDMNAEVPVFTQPATRGGYITHTAQQITRPTLNAPPKPTNVPLKCDQVNSHAAGASLFNAPVNPPIPKLKVPLDIRTEELYNRFNENDLKSDKYKPSAEYQPHSIEELVRGFRAPTTVKTGTVNEPTMNMYRPDASGVAANRQFGYYDAGMEELAQMSRGRR